MLAVVEEQAEAALQVEAGASRAAEGGGTGGESCVDVPEPNDTQTKAVQLPDLQDSDPSRTQAGLKSEGDYDYFHFQGKDACTFTEVSPGATTKDKIRICMFSACPYELRCAETYTGAQSGASGRSQFASNAVPPTGSSARSRGPPSTAGAQARVHKT